MQRWGSFFLPFSFSRGFLGHIVSRRACANRSYPSPFSYNHVAIKPVMVRQSSRSAASRAREALQSTAPQKRKTSGEAKQPAKRGKEEQENEGEEQEQVKQGKHDQSETKPEPEQEQEQEREEEKRDDKYRETDAKKGQEQHVKEEQEEPSTGVKAEAKTETKGEAEAETHADYGAHTENATDEGHAANVLEKGIIYFFFRGKMNVDDPADMEDVARTFIVLRPIPPACHLEEGIEGEKGVKKEETGEQGDEAKKEQEQKQQQQQDDKPRALPKGGEKKCRLLILPKKTLPASPKDRFVSWVEKAGTDIETIRNSFKGEEHQTKTRGLRHTPGVTPFAEGVYAITSNGPQAGAGSHRTSGASHIAYMLTVPNEMTQVQIDFGLEDKGSFIAQVKNPSYKGPRFAPSRAPEYPPE